MELFYSTVIIGAGPAGTACGITLRRRNADVLIIDKAVFPRHKTCAGLVTGKTYALIRELLGGDPPDDLFSAVSPQVRLFHGTGLLTAAELEHPVHLVSRAHFDNVLVERYRALGGDLREGEHDYVINYPIKTITLSGGDTIRYNNLIFADGALSQSRSMTGIRQTDLAFGIETYIPAELLPTDSVDLYFGYLDYGYVWVFPHGDTVCVGAANQYKKGEPYRDILGAFLRDHGIDPDGLRYIGAFLPYGKTADQNNAPRDTLLVGDAAGLTDPISGEGLYMALASGIYAAESVDKSSIKQAYLRRIAPLERIIKEGRHVRRTFYNPVIQRTFLRKVNGNSRAVSFFFENMVEDYRYSYHALPRLYRDYKKQ